MEIPCFKCQLLNAGRRDFSQWIKNSLGSRLLWGKEEKWSHGRITIILTDSSSLLALYVHFFCDIVPPFYFLPDPSNLSARSLDNGIQQKLQEEILLQQNDQCSDIQPPFWSHCTLSVSMGRSWGYGRVSVCVCVCLGVCEGAQQCCVPAVVCSARAAGHQQGVLQEPASSEAFRKLLMWNHGFCNQWQWITNLSQLCSAVCSRLQVTEPPTYEEVEIDHSSCSFLHLCI